MAAIDWSGTADPPATDIAVPVPGDLTDEQWESVEPLIPRPVRPGGRPRIHSYRRLLDAVLYVTATGVRWHELPSHYPPWQTVNAYATRWRRSGVLDRVREVLGTAVDPPDN